MRSIVVCGLLMLSAAIAWAEDGAKIAVNDLVAPISPDVFVVRQDGQRPSISTLDWPLQVTRTNLVHLKLDTDPPVYLARDEALTVDDAIEHYNEKIAEVSNEDETADWLKLRGDCHLHSESYDQAASDYIAVCKLRPDSERHALQAAGACQIAHWYESSLSVCDNLLQRKPDSAMAHYWRGRALSGRHDTQGAILAFDQAILLDPKYADSYSRRSNMYLITRDYVSALRDAKKAIELDTSVPYYILAMLGYVANNARDEAVECVREGLNAHPADQMLLFAYVMMLCANDQEEDLEEKYRSHPLAADLLTLVRCSRAKNQGRLDDAVAEATLGISRGSQFKPMFLLTRAQVLFDKGEDKLALTDLDVVIQSGSDTYGAFELRGLHSLEVGDLPGAEAEFAKAIEEDPERTGAHLGLAQVHIRKGDFGAARHEIDIAAENDPQDVSVVLAAARLEIAALHFNPAIAICEQAIKIAGDKERESLQFVTLTDDGFKIGFARNSAWCPARDRYRTTVSALALRGYAQARQGSYTAALADAWRVCTLPVVSK